MQDVTALLISVKHGQANSMNLLFPLVYQELHKLAHRQLKREQSDFTLNTTALVHEAYLKLVKQPQLSAENRNHFFAIAAQLMRQILVDQAKLRSAQKRGGKQQDLDIEDVMPWLSSEESEHLLELNEALERLKIMNERAYQVVIYRFFGGLNYDEIAAILDTTNITVRRAWTTAKIWLNRELAENKLMASIND
jgi:RNA polymerase sigma factor (TIGR02999 family)